MPIDIEETNIGAHAILVDPEGKIFLQQRNNDPHILNPGLITMFGGSSYKNEPIETTLKRELFEELELDLRKFKFSFLTTLYKTKAVDRVDYTLHLFVVENVHRADLKLHEGKSIFHGTPDEALRTGKLTRICHLAIQSLLENEQTKGRSAH